MHPPDTSKWTCIYPSYLDSRLKVAQGRRVSKALAVENPTLQEISEILGFFRLPHALENKVFPRDILARGRFKVMLKHPAGHLSNPEIPNSKSYVEKRLLVKLCELIPRLKSRMAGEEVKAPVDKKKKKKGRR